MNRNEGREIHVSNLEVGDVYRFKSAVLGEVNLQFMGGSKFRVTEGKLQSQKDKKKQWTVGAEFTLPNLNIGKFYELLDIGDAE